MYLFWGQDQGESRRVFLIIEGTMVTLIVQINIGLKKRDMYCSGMITLLNVKKINKDVIINYHLTQGGEELHTRNKALKIIYLNLSH